MINLLPFRILQEAQNMMALTHVDTPLKGGLNTPLHNSDFSGVVPQAQTMSTPNTVLATPFRTSRSDGSATPGSTPGFMTPKSGASVPASVGMTPSVRDKLNINSEDGIDIGSTPAAHKVYQNSLKEQLRMGLSSLPQPKNDYEIVVPDNEEEEIPEQAQENMVSFIYIIGSLKTSKDGNIGQVTEWRNYKEMSQKRIKYYVPLNYCLNTQR